MIFKGVKIRFDCKNNQQFTGIGEFWKHMRDLYPNDSLKGVGCNWDNDCLDYIIGDFVTARNYNMCATIECYPNAEYVEIDLPDKGWQIYHCRINELASLYDEIYKDGALDYEIEEIDAYGNCKISILRV